MLRHRRLASCLALAALLTACGGRATAPATTATATTARPTEAAATPTAAARAVAAALHTYTTAVFPVPRGSAPHDVAPAPDGSVWYTGQASGELGRLDPKTGEVRRIPLGTGSRPHGVIVGPDGHAWVTDGGLNAIVRVAADTQRVTVYRLPENRPRANLNTAAFDRRGRLWFTGQSGIYGVLDISTGAMQVYDAPRNAGPYGIAATPAGDIYYASLAGSYIAAIDLETGAANVIEPPTPRQGARRVWSDSRGAVWVSEWNAGKVGRYEPASARWQEWTLPGARPQAYAVYVDERDVVWLSDFGANSLTWFDPRGEQFGVIPLPAPGANVRQLLGRRGEVWGAMSGTDALIVVRYP